MKLYVAVCEDRHSDVDIAVFDTPEKAIEYAKDFARGNERHPELMPEDERFQDIPEWVYNETYDYEGDSVHVIATTLNNEEE